MPAQADACGRFATGCRQRAVATDGERLARAVQTYAAHLYAGLFSFARHTVRALKGNGCRARADDAAGDGDIAECDTYAVGNRHCARC